VTTRISGGQHRGRSIKTPTFGGLRPTSERVRAAVFSIIGPDAVEGKRVLDLYAGTGALGIDALSRGAACADFVERDGRMRKAIRGILAQLAMKGNARVHSGQVKKVLHRLEGPYDLVFADPPYESGELIGLLDDLESLNLVADEATIIFEYSSKAELIEPTGRFSHITDRRYGDTLITIMEAGTTDAKSSLSRNI
jgi:16S rRNA (guanine966-N2)-methyltransferase